MGIFCRNVSKFYFIFFFRFPSIQIIICIALFNSFLGLSNTIVANSILCSFKFLSFTCLALLGLWLIFVFYAIVASINSKWTGSRENREGEDMR